MKTDYRKIKIEKETSCSACLHGRVCGMDFEKRCKNYLFGDSQPSTACMRCTNHYSRYSSRNPLPCFVCDDFLSEKGLKHEEKTKK
jgi:hypothetical protein